MTARLRAAVIALAGLLTIVLVACAAVVASVGARPDDDWSGSVLRPATATFDDVARAQRAAQAAAESSPVGSAGSNGTSDLPPPPAAIETDVVPAILPDVGAHLVRAPGPEARPLRPGQQQAHVLTAAEIFAAPMRVRWSAPSAPPSAQPSSPP